PDSRIRHRSADGNSRPLSGGTGCRALSCGEAVWLECAESNRRGASGSPPVEQQRSYLARIGGLIPALCVRNKGW
ncbi:MAG: hypothetical protein ACREF4_11460, partial [Gammaproteobacteria bacterium]